MEDSGKKPKSQPIMLDHLIQQMAAGISPQGQYSQFGFVTPPELIWSDKENNCMPPVFNSNQNKPFNVGIGCHSNSARSTSDDSLFYSPMNYVSSAGSFLDNVFPCSSTVDKPTLVNEIPVRQHEPFRSSPIFSNFTEPDNLSAAMRADFEVKVPPSTFLDSECPFMSSNSPVDTKPSYSDIVSKASSNRVASNEPFGSASSPSPTMPRHFKGTSSTKTKDKGNGKQNSWSKRNQTGWSNDRGAGVKELSSDSPRLNQRKSSLSTKKSDADKRRRSSLDSAFDYGLENISLDDPFPKVKDDQYVTVDSLKPKCGTDCMKSENKPPKVPLNNESNVCTPSSKNCLSKRPLNINNNLSASKSSRRPSPVSPTVPKSCNQDEWNSINKSKCTEPSYKVESFSSTCEPLARKSSDPKPKIAKSFFSSSFSWGKSEKKNKEVVNKRKRRKCGESYPYFEELLKTAFVYFSAWANMALVFLMWLFQLICDVTYMSSKLLLHLLLVCFEKIRYAMVKVSTVLSYYLKSHLIKFWPFNDKSKKKFGGLSENIVLPTTGDEAMKRLLACRGEDPYGILGVTTDCSDEDIKKFYKRQAILVHPDKNRQPGAEEAFKVLGHAFDLIGQPVKRKEYDNKTFKEKEMSAAMQEFSDLIKELHRKMEETANTICCTNCNGKHKRKKTDRPAFSARYCKKCEIRHAAREGDLWAESSMFGFLWHYFSCMDGAVYDITEWAACQSDRLKHLQANTHVIQYRIVTGGNNNTSGRWGGKKSKYDIPSEADLEEFLNNIYQQTMPGASKSSDWMNKPSTTSKRKMKKKRS